MKGHFSIEWLAQSSQATSSTGPRAPANPWPESDQGSPCTSSTHPESLPGFYCSKRLGGMEPQERVEELQSLNVHDFPVTRTPGPNSDRPTQCQSSTQEAGFNSGAEEEETSGYESEGGRSLSPSPVTEDIQATSPTTGRRPRTAFTAEQINRLEKAFKRNAYLGTHDKAELCRRLNLSDKQIRNWFQNRRMKLKRTLQDALAQACQAKVASQLMHYPELQAFRPSPYPSYYPTQENLAPHLGSSGLHYTPSPAVGAIPALPLDSLYQCGSLPALVAPPGSAPLMPSYHLYPHRY